MTDTNETEVRNLMRRYFDGLYGADSAILRTVLHPAFSYVNADATGQEFLGLDAYMARIDARTSPSSRGEPRNESVERIMLKDGQMGFVEAQTTMLGRDYQDYLTLIRADGEWKIIAKVFTAREQEA